MTRRIVMLVLTAMLALTMSAQDQKPAPTKWNGPKKEKIPVLSGVAVFADLCGPIMKAVGADYNQWEFGARLALKERFYPIFEMGIGECTRPGREQPNVFKTTGVYMRGGMDLNLNKKVSGNRLFVGARFAYTSFDYDFYQPVQTDPVWGGSRPLDLSGVNAQVMWFEGVLGFETKLWSFIRLGWNFRYKYRLTDDFSQLGQPWYIPGFGRNDESGFGGALNLVFDVGKSMKKNKK